MEGAADEKKASASNLNPYLKGEEGHKTGGFGCGEEPEGEACAGFSTGQQALLSFLGEERGQWFPPQQCGVFQGSEKAAHPHRRAFPKGQG